MTPANGGGPADLDAVIPDADVPDGEKPVRCGRCGRPFTGERARDLHLGERHDGLTDVETAAYESAHDAEGDELFVYHLKVIGALGAFYAVFVLVYMVVLSG